MKCLFLYNPVSGKSKKVIKKLKYIQNQLLLKYRRVDILESKYSGHIEMLAKQACGIYDAIVFAGGDGTFNEVINGIVKEPKKPKLGYIPSGTAGDISRNLKISRNVKKAVKNILKGNIIEKEIYKVNDRHFVYVVAAGTYTAISFNSDQKKKIKFGKFAYIINGIKNIFKQIRIPYVVSSPNINDKGQAELILIKQSNYIAGFKIGKTSLETGGIEVIIVEANKCKIPFKIWLLILFRIERTKNRKWIKFYETNEVIINVADYFQWSVDGEKGDKGMIKIESSNKTVELFVPRNKKH